MHRIAVALALGLACAQGGTDPSPRIAEGPDFTLTLDELDAEVKEALWQQRTEGRPTAVYELRAQVLDELVEAHVVEQEARRRGVEVEALFEAQPAAVPEEEARAFYEQNRHRLRGEASFEDVEESIRRHLAAREVEAEIAALVDAAGIRIHLEPPRLDVAAEGPSKGPEDAPITIVEFSDFQCPYCRRARPVVDELLERYPEALRLVYRHLPLESIHPRARAAAEASACAEDQGRFWAFHDAIFDHPEAFADEDLRAHAEAIGLDLEAYDACVGERVHAARVSADVEAARSAGITGTPAFLVNGVLLTGAQPIEAFERVIERDLEALEAAAP